MLITQSPQFPLGDSVLLLPPVHCLVLCSAASSRKPDSSDFNLEELIFSRNRKFGDWPLCVQIEQLHPITAGPRCLLFSWPLPPFSGSKRQFCIQGRRKMGREEEKATPASPVSFCHGSKSCPEFALSPEDFCLRLPAQNQLTWELPTTRGSVEQSWACCGRKQN